MFVIKLADMFKNPTTPIGVIGWFNGGAMNLAGPILYLVQIGWSVSVCLEWFFPLTGFGTTESGIDRCVLRSFIVIAMLMFIVSWLAFVISNFRSSRIIGAVASTSERTIFARAKVGH